MIVSSSRMSCGVAGWTGAAGTTAGESMGLKIEGWAHRPSFVAGWGALGFFLGATPIESQRGRRPQQAIRGI